MKISATILGLSLTLAAPAHADWWKPVAAPEWQWMISHPLRLNNATDMGTGKTAWNGAKPPGTDPVVYDIDGFENTAATVATLHSMGKKVVCYIEVGAAENYRSDYSQFPPETLGRKMGGYASERYIDIRDARVVAIIKARIKMCHDKGFDAIEPDIDESYASRTGFPLTQLDAVNYMRTLSDYAHSLGMGYWAKNPDDTGDDYAMKLFDIVDAVLTEECNQYGTCGALSTYTGKKAVFNAEYGLTTGQFCAKDNARVGWNGVKFPVSLKGGRTPCK